MTDDFREFVFRATGKDTHPGNLDRIDLFDNLVGELDRLGALAELLDSLQDESLDRRAVSGLALLLGDIRARMRKILDLSLHRSGKKASP